LNGQSIVTGCSFGTCIPEFPGMFRTDDFRASLSDFSAVFLTLSNNVFSGEFMYNLQRFEAEEH